MIKTFNVNGACRPEKHYMVDLTSRLKVIKKMVDDGAYFTINRARQFGKTTTLNALADYLEKDYEVISLDFQTMGALSFESEETFVAAFSGELLDSVDGFPDGIENQLLAFADGTARINSLNALFRVIKVWCGKLEKAPVLIIDEVDTATNNQVFIDFLAQLRAYYLKRPKVSTFQSVILAGVYDIRNIRRKIRTEEDHKTNSPWNIAAEFNIEMSFSPTDIAAMLAEYNADHNLTMDVTAIADMIYEYTSGYPYLVSRICKVMDEQLPQKAAYAVPGAAWTKEGFLTAVQIVLGEISPLFDSLIGKLNDYPELKNLIYLLLFRGQRIAYSPDDPDIRMAVMFGFVKVEENAVVIANRIFETRLYNYFLTLAKEQNSDLYAEGSRHMDQFIKDNGLDMRLILERFVAAFDDLYGDQPQKFVEEDGRRYFLLYLRPIINGTGNYYIESRTRNQERTDVIIDYRGNQYVCELKIWRGNSYNERGENQLSSYLDYYHLNKGYMLSFNFNKKKEIGVKEIVLGDKVLIEAVV
ncbi:MAG: ATP-binding protein [Clostridiales bacterium]|nr:ATP-binding protein [Clostridiales bacterium]